METSERDSRTQIYSIVNLQDARLNRFGNAGSLVSGAAETLVRGAFHPEPVNKQNKLLLDQEPLQMEM